MFRMTRKTMAAASSVVLAAAVAVTLVACTSDDPDPSTTTSSSTASTSASPSPSPTAVTPEEEAIEDAEEALRLYYQTADASIQDPVNFNAAEFEGVAYGTALTDLQERFYGVKEQGLRQTGVVTLETVENTVVDLTNDQTVSPPMVPIVEFKVCYDVSALNVVDADGKSVVSPDRKPRGVDRVGVVNYEYPDGAWRVLFIEHLEETC